MKLNNTHRALYDAVSQIDPNLIEEATAPKRVLPSWKKVAAVAAVLALLIGLAFAPSENTNEVEKIVIAPGILKVYAYDLSTGTEISNMVRYELSDSVIGDTCEWTSITNSLYGLPLTLEIDEKAFDLANITFEVSVTHGGFYGDIHNDKYKKDKNDPVAKMKDVNFGKEFTIENGETIFWSDRALIVEAAEKGISYYEYVAKIGSIDVNIVIKCNSHIVGYALIKIESKREGWFTASAEKIVHFPKVDGEYQVVTMADLGRVMDEVMQ